MITIYDPLDPKKEYRLYKDYMIKDNIIYLKTEFSNCILALECINNELFNVYTKERLGRRYESK